MFVQLFYITLKVKLTLSYDVSLETIDSVYTNSFTRISPYFSGIAGGWIYATYKGKSTVSMVNNSKYKSKIKTPMTEFTSHSILCTENGGIAVEIYLRKNKKVKLNKGVLIFYLNQNLIGLNKIIRAIFYFRKFCGVQRYFQH
jgi:hypothetical protein